jgi:hypothetical protein
MIPAFDKLNDAEVETMLRAPLLVCILIAGADGTIDRKEMQKAVELSKKKSNKVRGTLAEYYRMVTEDFEDKLKIVMQSLPLDDKERNHEISEELGNINQIMPRLEKNLAREFHLSLRYIAAQIAESSGGLLGIKSIGEEEEHYVELPMIKAPA